MSISKKCDQKFFKFRALKKVILLSCLIFLSSVILSSAQLMPEDIVLPDKLSDVPQHLRAPVVEPKVVHAAKTLVHILDLKSMDIYDVLKIIAQKTGLNIVAGKGVQGKVSIYLKDVEALEALRVISKSHGWAYDQEEDIVHVMTEQEYIKKYGFAFGRETHTKIYQLEFAIAEDVKNLLSQIKTDAGQLIIDGKTNVLIVKDVPEKVAEMESVLTKVDVPIQTLVFPVNYAIAEELSAKIQELLTPAVGSVRFDERSNRIIVSDIASKLESIEQLILAFDQRQKEVFIEAKIIQITLSDEFKMGVDWEALVEGYHDLSFNSNFDILGTTNKAGRVSIGTISNDNYTAMLEALDVIGSTEILSSPRITALNNEEAKILVGSSEPYVTTTTTTPASGPTTIAESVDFIEVGVKLYVTPTIHPDDFITMKIKPEVSSVVRNITTSNNNTIPVVETSEAETTVMVKDGVTVVIGGLIKDERITETKKIPMLGNIPMMKRIFSSERDFTRKTEIIIFLSPHIITGEAPEETHF